MALICIFSHDQLALLLELVSRHERNIVGPLPTTNGIHAKWKIVVGGCAIINIIIAQGHLVCPVD